MMWSPEAVEEQYKWSASGYKYWIQIKTFPKCRNNIFASFVCYHWIKGLLRWNNWEKSSGHASTDRKFHWHRSAAHLEPPHSAWCTEILVRALGRCWVWADMACKTQGTSGTTQRHRFTGESLGTRTWLFSLHYPKPEQHILQCHMA